MPQFPVPDGRDEESWLRKEVARGLRARSPTGCPRLIAAQAEYELERRLPDGLPRLLPGQARPVRVRAAPANPRRPGPWSAGRGADRRTRCGITELDPIAHKLLFERFLNPDRISMPDIDMDFDERRRGDMIRYATRSTARSAVAQIITYSTIKAKAAVKDAGRVLGYPFALGDRITKAMPPPVMGKDMPLTGIFDPAHPRYAEAAEFRTLYQSEPDVQKVVDTAKGLEGSSGSGGCTPPG
jgi:DNA polymerase-3 subunit alpha